MNHAIDFLTAVAIIAGVILAFELAGAAFVAAFLTSPWYTLRARIAAKIFLRGGVFF
jgi:hypothetical protein